MHNYTHEYKRASKKVGNRKVTFLSYLGSRCSTEGCTDNRRPARLDTVQAHNDATGEMFSRGSSRVVKQQ